MIGVLLSVLSSAWACDALSEPPAAVQMAWVSQVRATVGADAPMQVVRSTELQQLASSRGADVASVLRAIGLVGPHAEPAVEDWKVSVFDVSRDALCRPMAGVAGDVRSGVPICEDNLQDRWRGTRARAWTGCGYLQDVATGARTLDVFRLRWADAVKDGFCLLPIARLLAGRPG